MPVIKVNDDSISSIMQVLNKLSAELDGAITGNLGSLTSFPLIGDGIKKIQKNVRKMGSRAKNTSRIVAKQKDAFMSSELIITDMFNEIEIPTELNNVYSPVESEIRQVEIEKQDGASVNEGEAAQEKEVEIKSQIKIADLSNLTVNPKDLNEKGLQTNNIDDNIDEQAMANINNEIEQETQVFDDSNEMIANTALNQMGNTEEQQIKEYKDNTEQLIKKELTQIANSHEQQIKEYKDNTEDLEKANITQMNTSTDSLKTNELDLAQDVVHREKLMQMNSTPDTLADINYDELFNYTR